YNRNTAPGPIADYAWVKRALNYAVACVRRRKLLLGIPLYGREWIQGERDTPARTLSFADINALLTGRGIRAQWDIKWRSPRFEFQDASGRHTVWFEDSRSLRDKLSLVREYGLGGFAAWRLGDDDPAFWRLVANKSSPRRRVAARPGTRQGRPRSNAGK